MMDAVPVTETITWLAPPPPPHPVTQRLAEANAVASNMFLALLCHIIPTVSPRFARLAMVRLCCATKFPSLCEYHNHSHTLECPAHSEPERPQRLEIINTSPIFQKLLEQGPHL